MSDLTMTTICRACQYQYGRWRTRCPTCGTAIPRSEQVTADAAVRATIGRGVTPRSPKGRRRREPRPDDCIACQRRGAKARCPHCEEPIHRDCLRLHAGGCAKFQVELQAEHARLRQGK